MNGWNSRRPAHFVSWRSGNTLMMDVSKVSEDLLHEDDNLEEATMDIDVLTQKTRPQLQASKTKSALNYKSYQDLSLAIRNNFVKIPRDVDLVIGVPDRECYRQQ